MARILEGVKCIAVSIYQMGTVPCAMLADMGAEVIKIEQPGIGENGRNLTRSDDSPLSAYFELNNRGVKSITLNLKKKEAREILYMLVKEADIFLQNIRPGAAERNGFSYEDLSKVNPGIVYLSCSAYGPKGPWADMPGTDSVGQAVGGLASSFGEEDIPMATGQIPIADQVGGYMACIAALLGLYHRKMTGEGQKIDVSMLGGQIHLMGWVMNQYLFTGNIPRRDRIRIIPGSLLSITANLPTKDGNSFVFQIIGERKWKDAMAAMGFERAIADAGINSLGEISSSVEKQKLLLDTLDKLFATKSRDEILKNLQSADIVCAPIFDLAEAVKLPDVEANNYIIEIDHPKAGRIKEVGYPYQFSKTPPKAGIAPELGENTAEILKGLGYSLTDIDELKNKEVI